MRKIRSVTLYHRTFLIGAALALFSVAGVRAQSVDLPGSWARCETDVLASEIVPATPDMPPVEQAPLQADAGQIESSATQSLLEGNVNLSRGEQRLRAERIRIDREANRAQAMGGFVYGDSRQACLLYTSPSPRDATLSRMPSSA